LLIVIEFFMQKPLISLPLISSTPLEIEVRRAGARESLHLVDIVLCDAEGRLILALGNEEAEIFPRSAIKPLQAIPLIEKLLRDGKADIFGDEEISFICASHNGEPHHVTCARSLLNRFSIDEEALICGAHWSLDTDILIEQVRSLAHPTRAHNNCSGKHSGMLVLAHLEGPAPSRLSSSKPSHPAKYSGRFGNDDRTRYSQLHAWHRWVRARLPIVRLWEIGHAA
jgi:L-asparaginase II